MNHGVRSTYERHGCRCEPCRKANNDYAKKRRNAAKASPPANLNHGKASTYANYGCRCEMCADARSKELRRQASARKGKQPPSHGVSGYKHYDCRCEACRQAAAAERSARDAGADGGKYTQRAQDATLAQAKRHGDQWTGPELEIASRKDLTARQVAFMLGRSLSAVRNVRDRLRNDDPKMARIIGPQP